MPTKKGWRLSDKVYKPTVPARRRPVVLEAVQWFPGDNVEGVEESGCCDEHRVGLIQTLEGLHTIHPGYWVMTGVKGEHWGVEPGVFKQTYDILRWCSKRTQGCKELAGHRWADYIPHTFENLTREEVIADEARLRGA